VISSAILGGIVGLLLGLLVCYYKQLHAVYEQRNLISSGSDVITSAQNFYGELKKL
jgi:hypothetical protein